MLVARLVDRTAVARDVALERAVVIGCHVLPRATPSQCAYIDSMNKPKTPKTVKLTLDTQALRLLSGSDLGTVVGGKPQSDGNGVCHPGRPSDNGCC